MKRIFQIITVCLLFPTTYFTQNLSTEEVFLNGKKLFDSGDYSNAINLFESCVEQDESSAEFHYWLGAANIEALQQDDNFFKKGLYAFNAQNALNKAVKLNPAHVDARIRLSNYYLNAPLIAGGSSSEAKKHALIVKNYDKERGILLLANIHLKNNNLKEAKSSYKQLLMLDTVPKKSYYLLSTIYLELNQPDSALLYCKHSISEFPAYLTAYYQFAKISAQKELEVDEALEKINYFISTEKENKFPKLHWAYLRLGELYELKDETNHAMSAYKNLSLQPDFKKAKEALSKLEN